MALSMSQSHSARALLHSIMPMPVRSRSSLTFSAVISMVFLSGRSDLFGDLALRRPALGGRRGLPGRLLLEEFLADPVLFAFDDRFRGLGGKKLDGPHRVV